MPFTVSHIAAVLPGYRPLKRAHVLTAAVIGSMVPDFGLLVPGFMARWQTHSLPGLFTFCLPIGLAALAGGATKVATETSAAPTAPHPIDLTRQPS